MANYTEDSYPWDTAYNSDKKESVGNTTDYLHTNIRKVLNEYYESNFDNDSKAKIVSKNLCVGKYNENDSFSTEKECSIIKENEKIGLLTATDYQNACLDTKCNVIEAMECGNRNYLSKDGFYTWLLNSTLENSYNVLYLDRTIDESKASNEIGINPIIYITNKSIVPEGNGTIEKPYIIK